MSKQNTSITAFRSHSRLSDRQWLATISGPLISSRQPKVNPCFVQKEVQFVENAHDPEGESPITAKESWRPYLRSCGSLAMTLLEMSRMIISNMEMKKCLI